MRCLYFSSVLVAAGAYLVCFQLRIAAADEDKPTLNDLAWLAGSWLEKKDGVETEEHWIAPKGGIMLGVSRTTREKGRTSHEFLRIVERPEGGIAYLAQPGGAPPTVFPLKEMKEQQVVFENPKHDFPQRIIYRLDGHGRLVGRIEGETGGAARAMEWVWEKTKPN